MWPSSAHVARVAAGLVPACQCREQYWGFGDFLWWPKWRIRGHFGPLLPYTWVTWVTWVTVSALVLFSSLQAPSDLDCGVVGLQNGTLGCHQEAGLVRLVSSPVLWLKKYGDRVHSRSHVWENRSPQHFSFVGLSQVESPNMSRMSGYNRLSWNTFVAGRMPERMPLCGATFLSQLLDCARWVQELGCRICVWHSPRDRPLNSSTSVRSVTKRKAEDLNEWLSNPKGYELSSMGTWVAVASIATPGCVFQCATASTCSIANPNLAFPCPGCISESFKFGCPTYPAFTFSPKLGHESRMTCVLLVYNAFSVSSLSYFVLRMSLFRVSETMNRMNRMNCNLPQISQHSQGTMPRNSASRAKWSDAKGAPQRSTTLKLYVSWCLMTCVTIVWQNLSKLDVRSLYDLYQFGRCGANLQLGWSLI